MDDIRNVVFLQTHDVTKQNGRACEGTLYRKLLGQIVVHYDNVYKIEKGPRWGIYSIIESIWAYFCTHLRFLVCFPIRSYFASLQGVYYFVLLLSNGSMSQTLRTTSIFITCWSFFRPHTSTPVLSIVTSLRISVIITFAHQPYGYVTILVACARYFTTHPESNLVAKAMHC